MSCFDERLGLTIEIEKNIKELFSNDIIQEFGCDKIINTGTEMFDFLRTPEINQMPSGMIIKFAPDFIILAREKPQKIYFLDVKHSVSPIYAPNRLNLMRKQASDNTLEISDVGIVAREALLAYRRYYPSTIILMASPYNSKKLMAQFADKIKCLYCYRSIQPDYDCNNCPAKNGGFFDIERAGKSTGSQTPMTNIDLRSFEPAKIFFHKLGIEINDSTLAKIEEKIINEPIAFDYKVADMRKIEILKSLIDSGCNWVENQIPILENQSSSEVYSCKGNSFIHFSKNCRCLIKNNIIIYDNIEQAKKDGKKTNCKFCSKKI